MGFQVLLGNLFRGSPVKCLTQINHWLVGAGVLTLLSNVLRVILKAGKHSSVFYLSSGFFLHWTHASSVFHKRVSEAVPRLVIETGGLG